MADSEQNKDHSAEQLRAQAEMLLSQARTQLAEIQRALGAVVGDSALQSRLAALAGEISGAIGALSQAIHAPGATLRPVDLMALDGMVHSSETAALLAQATAQASAVSAIQMQAVAAAAAATREETQIVAADMFDRHLFDAYLHFSSAEDEAEFRRREAEARKYIDAQLARRTPEGDLNAGGGMLGIMLDAHTHGAGDSPDFMPRWNALVEKTQRQRAAMQAAGQSTAEFDRTLATSCRRFLEAKGLSDAEIDRRLAGSASPLEAARTLLGQDHDSRRLENQMELAARPAAASQPLPQVEASETPALPAAPATINVDAMSAKLKAAGVLITDDAAADHGLTIQKPAGKPGPGVAG
jgi:hypothetical protein